MGIQREQYNQNISKYKPNIQNNINTNCIEMYSNYSQFIVLHEIVYFMKSMGILDFSIRDINNPDPNRTQRILSAVMNYMKFHSSFLQIYEDATITTSDVYEKKSIIQRELDEINNKLQIIEKECEEYKPKIVTQEKILDDLKNKIQELNNSIDIYVQKCTSIEQEIETVCVDIQNVKLSIESIKNDLDSIESQIVSSPHKIQASLASLHRDIATTRDDITTINTTINELQACLQCLVTSKSELVQIYEQLNALQHDFQVFTKLVHSTITTMNMKQELTDEIQSLIRKNQQTKDTIELIQDSLQNHEQRFETIQSELQAQIRDVRCIYYILIFSFLIYIYIFFIYSSKNSEKNQNFYVHKTKNV